MTNLDRLDRYLGKKPEEDKADPPRADMVWPIEALVPGRVIQAGAGSLFLGESTFPPDHRCGHARLSGFWQEGLKNARYILSRDADLTGLDQGRVVFLDTETTGLAGGSGTYAFLVGIGYFLSGDFIIQQYFMRDFHEERLLLSALQQALSRFAGVVSYNGKCFDLPLLETRFICSRLVNPLPDPIHLDLLFPSRRLWKRRLPDCSLGTVEREILGVRRTGDVPSGEIPLLYFNYLRSRDARPLVRVFDHNRQDILSLAALTGHVCELLSDASVLRLNQATATRHAMPAWHGHRVGIDLYSLGRVFSQASRHEASVACFHQALKKGVSPAERMEVLRSLGGSLRKLERWEEAVPVWEEMARECDSLDLSAHEELAKYYEHVRRDITRALTIVEEALERLEVVTGLPDSEEHVRRRSALHHRLARLKRKASGRRRE